MNNKSKIKEINLGEVVVSAKRPIKTQKVVDYNGTYIDPIGSEKPITRSEYYSNIKINPKFGSKFEASSPIYNTDKNKKDSIPKLDNGLPMGYLNQSLYGIDINSRSPIKPISSEISRMIPNGVVGESSNIPQSTGIDPMSAIGGISDIALGVGSAIKRDDESSTENYIGNIAGNAAKWAKAGTALGPYGMAAGAVIGGTIGLFNQNKLAAEQKFAEKKTEINKTITQNNSMNGNVNAQYNMQNQENTRVPGLNKGIASFKSNKFMPDIPNAMIANEEGIMDPSTNRVATIPGKYNKSNPDVVPANLSNGSSVYSKNPAQTLPGGNSTPADIIARAEKAQKINDKILYPKPGDRKLSKIDKNTAKLNQENISIQAENLNKFNYLINPQIQNTNLSQLPKYNAGNPLVIDTWAHPGKATQEEMDAHPNVIWQDGYAMGIRDPKDRVTTKSNTNSTSKVDSSTVSVATQNDVIQSAPQAAIDDTKVLPSDVAVNNQSIVNSAAPADKDKNGYVYNPSNKFIGSKLSSIGTNLASMAPIFYNARNTTPEIISPVYNDFINPNERYNIAPHIADSLKQRQIARYSNSAINSGSGASMAYGADLYSRGTEQLSKIMDAAETANVGYREQYANRYNQNAIQSANEIRRVNDLNARNRAAARNFEAQNANLISQYAQNQQLMSNQKKAALLNSDVWSAYASAMEKGQRNKMLQLIDEYSR